MIIEELKEHLKYLKKKDEIAIKKVERRFISRRSRDRKFVAKASDVYEVFNLRVPYMSEVLKEFVDNPLGELFFEKPFSEALVRSVLLDREFVASLMTNSLINRALKLERKSKGQLKLRIYSAILNFDRYKKNKWCE